mgnify:CR=1 FL=1
MKHVSLFLAAGCVVLLSLSALVGSAPMELGETFAALIGQGTEASRIIVWEIRLPRAVAAFGVGAALGLSGAGLQGLLQNPLAGPGVLGVSAFASLGAVIAIYFGLAAAGSFAVPLAAILFSGLAVALLLFAAGRGASTVTLLRALSLGEETAASLGVNPARTRLLIIVGTSLLAGASVAVAGTIGFVGMVAPHIVRPLVKHDPQRILLPSALAAGGMLLGADMLVRVLPFSQELKLGVAAALFGAPVFIWIAARLGGSTR